MRVQINHIDKLDFLEAYPSARIEAFKSETIKNSFAAAGLVPYNPDRVISKLDIRLRTPTPPSSQGSEWSLKTPSNYVQLQKQASSIRALLRTRSRSPPSPSDRALNQLVKGCQLAMHNATILAQENKELRAENEKKKRKNARSTRQIAIEGGLSVLEASTLIAQPDQAVLAPIPYEAGPAPAPSQPLS
ncbi:hypothetical protein PENANT_c225G09064 [Penicillium antarcticum]|uniref:Uncharacterized protein n=1 Tax=Penicillium antarcticum TaxID=416450 RepID=A0A1V6P6W8_9EURO|nr:hypothetical protein PENANT_c225G09064 [Penicillium antarcticum]